MRVTVRKNHQTPIIVEGRDQGRVALRLGRYDDRRARSVVLEPAEAHRVAFALLLESEGEAESGGSTAS